MTPQTSRRPPRRTPARAARAGFTLVEMLTVMGIIVLLLAITVPAVSSLSKSGGLNNAGRVFTNLLTIARSEAINRRTIVRVEVATDWPPDETLRYRRATITAAALSGSGYVYRQITGWETLPEGIVFEPTDPAPSANPQFTDGSLYFNDQNDLKNAPTGADQPTFAGQAIPTVYIAFTPTGALSLPPGTLTPVRARLTEGTLPAGGTSLLYTRRAAGTGYPGANWFDVRVNPLVGRLEIGRPDSQLPPQ